MVAGTGWTCSVWLAITVARKDNNATPKTSSGAASQAGWQAGRHGKGKFQF